MPVRLAGIRSAGLEFSTVAAYKFKEEVMVRSILIGLSVLAVSGFARNGAAEDGKSAIYDRPRLPAPIIAPPEDGRGKQPQPSPARVERLPKSRPPEHATAVVQGDELIIDRFAFTRETFTDMAKFEEDGEVTEEPVIRFGTACHPEATICKLSYVRAYVGEKEVKADRLAALLIKPRHLLLSPSGKNIDRFYREIFKDDCIVLILPDASVPAVMNADLKAPTGGNSPTKVN
jgi:hypothetical protein